MIIFIYLNSNLLVIWIKFINNNDFSGKENLCYTSIGLQEKQNETKVKIIGVL